MNLTLREFGRLDPATQTLMAPSEATTLSLMFHPLTKTTGTGSADHFFDVQSASLLAEFSTGPVIGKVRAAERAGTSAI
jgi:hypothetical protein